jgi:NTE family protein
MPVSPREEPGTILVLQGGGALGAYECGVYKVLSERLDDLSIISGTSIGAINAGVIARNFGAPDRGVSALEAFWHDLAFPRFPDWGSNPWMRLLGSFQAVATSMTFGNPHLFLPDLFGGGAPYSTNPMRQTVAATMGTYLKDTLPRLIVTAVELEKSQPRAFDSAEGDITPDHIVASGSLPPGFPPTEIEGSHYWDGGLWSNTPLSDVLKAVRGPHGPPPPQAGYEIYIVDVFPECFVPPDATVPTSPEVQARMGQIIYQDKTASDTSESEWVTRCLELYEILEAIPPGVVSGLEASLRQRVENARTDMEKDEVDIKKRIPVHVTHIRRESLPYEQISCGVDFSAGRIESLIEQGEQDARHALA